MWVMYVCMYLYITYVRRIVLYYCIRTHTTPFSFHIFHIILHPTPGNVSSLFGRKVRICQGNLHSTTLYLCMDTGTRTYLYTITLFPNFAPTTFHSITGRRRIYAVRDYIDNLVTICTYFNAVVGRMYTTGYK